MEKRLSFLDSTLAGLLLFIPLILILVTGEVRNSISDYAYSEYNYLFASLLTIAGMMFIFNGTAYCTKWYNVILGVALIGVSLTPHKEFSILHYSFAGIFFIGSVITMIVFSSRKQRKWKILTGLIIVGVLIGAYATNQYSLLVAEWIGMLPICLHFIGVETKKID